MIRIALKEIMNEKDISMTDIHNATGISRNTLNLLANGTSKGIQFETLEKLVNFLHCDINSLIVVERNKDHFIFNLKHIDTPKSKLGNVRFEFALKNLVDGVEIPLSGAINGKDNMYSIDVTLSNDSDTPEQVSYVLNYLYSFRPEHIEYISSSFAKHLIAMYEQLHEIFKTTITFPQDIYFYWLLEGGEYFNYRYYWKKEVLQNPIFDEVLKRRYDSPYTDR